MASFSFLTAGSIQFGAGKVAEVPGLLASYGCSRPVVVNDGGGRDGALTAALVAAGISYVSFSVRSEPDTKVVEDAVALATKEGVDCVVAIGGGSVIDTGKAIAALVTNGGRPIDYMEVIGAGKKITKPALPFIAIPTTSGTGAEVTKNAVLASKQHKQKVSLRSEFMLPRVALIDPLLTLSIPPHLTATTGLDAFVHCMEAYVTQLATPATDGFAQEGMARVAKSLLRAYRDGSDVEARTDMSLASVFGGISLANAKLGAVHGFAGPLAGQFNGPHGAVVAAMLPAAMRINIAALRARDPDGEALRRYTEVARVVCRDAGAKAEDGAAWAQRMCADMGVPGLERWGVTAAHAKGGSSLLAKAMGSSSMKGNPIKLTEQECAAMLLQSLESYAPNGKL